jgi:hypothetical protein
MAIGYQYTLERQENGGWLVRLPKVPEALTKEKPKRGPASTRSIASSLRSKDTSK